MFKYAMIIGILLVTFISCQFLFVPKINSYLQTRDAVNRVVGECSVLLAINISRAPYEKLQNVCVCIMNERKEFCGADEMCYRTDLEFNHQCFKDEGFIFGNVKGE